MLDNEKLESRFKFTESFSQESIAFIADFHGISFVYDFSPFSGDEKWNLKEEDIKNDRETEVESRKLIGEFHRAQESENERAKKEIVK